MDGIAKVSPDLAARTGTQPRYAREWLEGGGFMGFEVLPIEEFGFFRVYRLTS